jgi:hypothetical protein
MTVNGTFYWVFGILSIICYSEQNTIFLELVLFPFSDEKVGQHLLSSVHQKQLITITGLSIPKNCPTDMLNNSERGPSR